MAVKDQKNFKYGDLWPGGAPEPKGKGKGRELADARDYVTNKAFINYIESNGFKLYIDYDTSGIAYTTPSSKEIVVNGNYPDSMLGSLIQHELGHLMLFNASQFVSVNEPTMRSMVSKVLYTPDNLKDYGLKKLLYAENIVEDIIIETVSEGKCICHSTLEFNGVRAGVKHLDKLESATVIATEVCKNLLKEPLTELQKIASYEGLGGHLKSMIQELRYDLEEIDQELLRVHQNDEYINKRIYRRMNEITKVRVQVDRLKRKVTVKSSDKLKKILARTEAKLRVLQSKDRERHDNDEAEAERGRILARLQKKRNLSSELLGLLLAELTLVPVSDEDGDRPTGISSNRTDHLRPDSEEEADESHEGHSFDCGLPHPVTIDRSESRKQNSESILKRLNAKSTTKRIKLSEDDLDNVESNRKKTPENEFTYFKPAKREWDETDMLRGKRKKKASGINVLVGLDISGSMNTEWTTKFAELSSMVEDLSDELDIQSIYYFTYNHKLVETSEDISELTLKATGGNAFGFVYQEIMKNLPVMQKNEVILVTDCGDNLGWKLKDNCVLERNGEEVRNHISIIDTEEAGFYDLKSLHEPDWSLHRSNDPELFESLRNSIESLIES